MFYLNNNQAALPLSRESDRTLRKRVRDAFGEVAERLNAAVLKTAVGLALTVGSNPTLSVDYKRVMTTIGV